MKSNTDGGILFGVNDPGATAGKTVVVDCEEGLILRRDESDGSLTYGAEYFSGEMFRLYPGENEIVYNGPFAYLTFYWRNRWT